MLSPKKMLLLSLGTLSMTSCVTPQKALLPIDLVGKPITTYAVQGTGPLDRLQNKPIQIADYSATIEANSPWGSLPVSTQTQTEIGMTLGKNPHELTSGTKIIRNDAEIAFRLHNQGTQVANIRCRQTQEIEFDQTKVTNQKGQESFSLSSLNHYHSAFQCRADSALRQWQITLSNDQPKPLVGTLTLGDHTLKIQGSQASNIGSSATTVSYDIIWNGQSVATIDLTGDLTSKGSVTLLNDLDQKIEQGLMAASMALLLANDPLNTSQ